MGGTAPNPNPNPNPNPTPTPSPNPTPNPNPTPTPGPSLVDLGGDLVRDAQVAQHPRELRLHRV